MNIIRTLFLIIVFGVSLRAQTTLDTAVNFSVKDTHGYTHKLFNILDSNNYVVIDFFTTSCGPCTTYAPEFQQAYTHYGSNQNGVYFLGITWGSSNAMVLDFDSTYGLTYPTVSGSQGNGNSVVTDYNILSYPTVIIIAPDRLIKSQFVYPPDFQTLDSTISAVMSITTGIEQAVNQAVSGVFPNPAKSEIVVRHELAVPSEVSISVLSVLGETVLKTPTSYIPKGQLKQKINVADLPSGIYFVKILANGEKLTTLKFIKR